jgi:Rap1a immunity proteins
VGGFVRGSKTGVTLAGPDKAKAFALDSLRVACLPDNATLLQLARVLVKWLREHPERLHEPKSVLTTAALRDAFPCQQPTPKEAPKPTTVKP